MTSATYIKEIINNTGGYLHLQSGENPDDDFLIKNTDKDSKINVRIPEVGENGNEDDQKPIRISYGDNLDNKFYLFLNTGGFEIRYNIYYCIADRFVYSNVIFREILGDTKAGGDKKLEVGFVGTELSLRLTNL